MSADRYASQQHTVLYRNILYCTVMHCTVVYCTVLYCTALHCTVVYVLSSFFPNCHEIYPHLQRNHSSMTTLNLLVFTDTHMSVMKYVEVNSYHLYYGILRLIQIFCVRTRSGEIRVWDPKTGIQKGQPMRGHKKWVSLI